MFESLPVPLPHKSYIKATPIVTILQIHINFEWAFVLIKKMF